MKPLTSYRGYGGVLPGQGYRTPRGVATGVYGAVMGWWLGEESEEPRENPVQCDSVHHDFHLRSPGFEAGSSW
jgi:hypothetical protein